MLGSLFDHMEWADKQVLEHLSRLSNVPEKARKVYSHVIGTEHLWISRIQGEAAQVAVWPEIRLEECAALAKRNVETLRLLVNQSSAEALRRPITYRNTKGVQYTNPLHEILTHIATHGVYHRGQVAAHLRLAGIDPVDTDYIVYVRSVKS